MKPTSVGLRALLRDPMALFGLALASLLILSALFAPLLASHAPAAIDVAAKLQPPSAAHWLGTDEIGRDTWTRVLYGGRIALAVALAATVLSVGIGGALGLIAQIDFRFPPRAGRSCPPLAHVGSSACRFKISRRCLNRSGESTQTDDRLAATATAEHKGMERTSPFPCNLPNCPPNV